MEHDTSSKKSFSGKGIFPYKYAFTLLIPLRNLFLSPRTLIRRLELKPDMTVLEVGCGPGYFSPHIANALSQGTLHLMDIQPEMIDIAKKRLAKRNIRNVEFMVCSGNQLDFQDNSFDRLFLVTVLGEIENKPLYINEFYRILKPGGLVSISELWGDPDKLSVDEIKELFNDTEFTFYKQQGSTLNYTVTFRKQ